jgi:hypothetical protein
MKDDKISRFTLREVEILLDTLPHKAFYLLSIIKTSYLCLCSNSVIVMSHTRQFSLYEDTEENKPVLLL